MAQPVAKPLGTPVVCCVLFFFLSLTGLLGFWGQMAWLLVAEEVSFFSGFLKRLGLANPSAGSCQQKARCSKAYHVVFVLPCFALQPVQTFRGWPGFGWLLVGAQANPTNRDRDTDFFQLEPLERMDCHKG